MLSFLALPRWHKGRLWAADMFAGQVIAFAADGAAHVVITVPEVLAGFGWIPDGSLLVVTAAAGCCGRRLGRWLRCPARSAAGRCPAMR